jgi:DNA-binding MarR family transcriptional regulator
MRTSVRETSLNTYHSLQSKFGAQTCKIMAFMNENPQHNFTRREIASYLSIETSSVAGRVNQLVNDGDLIELPIKRKCSITGITAICLRLPLSQSDLFEVDA